MKDFFCYDCCQKYFLKSNKTTKSKYDSFEIYISPLNERNIEFGTVVRIDIYMICMCVKTINYLIQEIYQLLYLGMKQIVIYISNFYIFFLRIHRSYRKISTEAERALLFD